MAWWLGRLVVVRMRRKTCPTIRSTLSHEDNIMARRVAAAEPAAQWRINYVNEASNVS